MRYGTVYRVGQAERLEAEARCGGLYRTHRTLQVCSNGECTKCDGTHYTVHRERKPERVSPRSIASEAIARQRFGIGAEIAGPAERIGGEQRPKIFRPHKQPRVAPRGPIANPFRAILAVRTGPTSIAATLQESRTRAAHAARVLRESE